MTSLDSLPPDERAVLQLVLQRGRRYDDIAAMLSIDRAAVRDRALSAFDELGPETSVPPEARALITDYLLGQLPPRVADTVRDRLASSSSERAWARVLSSELAPLASEPLPEIPAEGATSAAADAAEAASPAAVAAATVGAEPELVAPEPAAPDADAPEAAVPEADAPDADAPDGSALEAIAPVAAAAALAAAAAEAPKRERKPLFLGRRRKRSAPKEDTPEEQAPQDETLDEQAPHDETLDEQTPHDETLDEQAPQDETVDEQAPHDETLDEQTPHDETLDEQTPHDETLDEQTPHDETFDEQASEDETPEALVPPYETPEEELASADETPEDQAPKAPKQRKPMFLGRKRGAAEAGTAAAVARLGRPDAPEDRPRSRRGGWALIIGAVVLIVVVIIIASSGGSSHKTNTGVANHTATTTPATTPATTPTTTPASTGATGATGTSGATGTAGAHVVAAFDLKSPSSKKTVGIAEVLTEQGQKGIAIVAQNVPANSAHDAYAVWLYNSPSDADRLGFVSPGVGTNGRLSTAGQLPSNASHFHQLIVTLETQSKPTQPGKIILAGPLHL
jgi:hypothetical protein